MTGMTRVIGAMVFLVLLATIYSLSIEQLPAENSVPDDPIISAKLFEGKTVLLHVDRSSALESKESRRLLKDVSIQKLGGRYFVTGEMVVPDDLEYKHYRGVSAGIAWEEVSEYRSFNNEQLVEYMKYWKEYNED